MEIDPIPTADEASIVLLGYIKYPVKEHNTNNMK